MKLNFKIIQRDLEDRITVPFAPTMIKKECGRILELLEKTPVPNYNKISGFDKWLIWHYWLEFDAFKPSDVENIVDWLVNKATSPDIIVRARQFLVEKNYLIPSPSIAERAQAAGNSWRKS